MPCLLCSYDEAEEQKISSLIKFNCPRCGEFIIHEDTLEDIEDVFNQIKNRTYLISGYTRETKEANRKPPKLTFENIPLIADQAPTKPLDKIDRILINLSNMSSYPGNEVFIDDLHELDYPLGYCINQHEFKYFIQYLEGSSLIQSRGSGLYWMTVNGWNRIEKIQQIAAKSTQVFVAMNFNKEFDDCYAEGIEKALKETRYKAYRIDREEHSDKIDDKILSEIKQSKFIIAEFTGQKHGVYFEAGYAFGLGIPVIWTCRENDLANLHFDTRQYNHIVWSNEVELKEKLINRIRVLIGENQ